MAKIVRLTESELQKLLKKVIKEQSEQTPSSQPSTTEVSENLNSLLNFLDANNLITIKNDRYNRGGYVVIVGNQNDKTNYLLELIPKLSKNYMDEIISWCNKNTKYQKYKVSHIQITREYFPS